MEIGIIGAGSVGMLFAAYLGSVYSVTLYTRTKEQAEQISAHGIVLKKPSGDTKVKIRAVPLEDWKGTEEAAIIAVKQYQLPSIIDKINQLKIYPDNLIFVQNGMGHLKWLETLKNHNVFVASVEHGALREGIYTVSHNGEGHTNVAVFKGNAAFLLKMSRDVPENFPVKFCLEYRGMLKNKLIVNAVINPLTAILNEKNGELVANTSYFQALKSLYAEIAGILNLENPKIHFDQIIRICKNTAENKSSMLKDLEAGRQTEADAILGYVVEEAKIKGKKAPLAETLYQLVKGKENNKGMK